MTLLPGAIDVREFRQIDTRITFTFLFMLRVRND